MSNYLHVDSLNTMADVWDCYQQDLMLVEDQILTNVGSDVPLAKEVETFILQAGGKRIRPLLLLLSAKLCGCQGRQMHALAAFVEYIHTATLLHDDVVDDARFRRGKEAAHRLWGNQASILVGDYLYAKAVSSIVDFQIHELNSVIAESVRRMTEGEIMQISLNSYQNVFSEHDYIQMVDRKTGALIAAACQMGAILGDADSSEQGALFQFGLQLGIAYQIVDDMLDYVGKGDSLGKTLGNDIQQGKITLPLLHLLKNIDDSGRKEIRSLLERESPDQGDVQRIVELMEKHGSVQYSIMTARQYVDRAKSSLIGFNESTAKQALCIAANYMTTRDC